MDLPYSKKCEINVRSFFRGRVPWIFGRCTIGEHAMELKYFFIKKNITYDKIKRAREVDNFIEIISGKETFQIGMPRRDEIIDFIKSKQFKNDN